jgi:hypothetical protein
MHYQHQANYQGHGGRQHAFKQQQRAFQHQGQALEDSSEEGLTEGITIMGVR